MVAYAGATLRHVNAFNHTPGTPYLVDRAEILHQQVLLLLRRDGSNLSRSAKSVAIATTTATVKITLQVTYRDTQAKLDPLHNGVGVRLVGRESGVVMIKHTP